MPSIAPNQITVPVINRTPPPHAHWSDDYEDEVQNTTYTKVAEDLQVLSQWGHDHNQFVLAHESGTNKLTVQSRNNQVALQKWAAYSRDGTNSGSFVLRNRESGLYISVDRRPNFIRAVNFGGSPKLEEPWKVVTLTGIRDECIFSCPKIGDDFGRITNGEGFLNVSGGGGYYYGQPIIMYPWRGGKQNMRWQIRAFDY